MYDHGHLSRAVCCRLSNGEPDIQTSLPKTFHINHPSLGQVSSFQPPREVQKTKEYSLNWCSADDGPEVTDGTIGRLVDK